MIKTLKITLLCSFVVMQSLTAQKTKTDGDWSLKEITLRNTSEAELMIRVGDIDNLNHGWEAGFSPFMGENTGIHPFPWNVDNKDPIGTDRIYVPSSYVDNYDEDLYYAPDAPCYADGYSDVLQKPEAITIPLTDLKGMKITAASLQFFIDDFQQVQKCSRFQVTLNGKIRLTQMEEMLRYIDQSGPIGKLITIKLNTEQLKLLNEKELSIFIDDPVTKAGDGYAIDFVKLLIHPKDQTNSGHIEGIVIDEENGMPIKNATVTIDEKKAITDAAGRFFFDEIAVGYWTAQAAAQNYTRNTITVDAYLKTSTTQKATVYTIPLRKEKGIVLNEKVLKEGDKITLEKIQFERSKFDLLANSKTELDKLIVLMKENKQLEIELSGHTSNEGIYKENVLLSKDRANACRNYLIENEIHPDRIKAVGYGPDKPITDNKTEAERKLNRRVEVQIMRMY